MAFSEGDHYNDEDDDWKWIHDTFWKEHKMRLMDILDVGFGF